MIALISAAENVAAALLVAALMLYGITAHAQSATNTCRPPQVIPLTATELAPRLVVDAPLAEPLASRGVVVIPYCGWSTITALKKSAGFAKRLLMGRSLAPSRRATRRRRFRIPTIMLPAELGFRTNRLLRIDPLRRATLIGASDGRDWGKVLCGRRLPAVAGTFIGDVTDVVGIDALGATKL